MKKTKHERTTRNIRKPGDMGKLKFCTFTQNCNGKLSNQPQGLIDEIFNELNINPQQIIPEYLKNSSLVN